jgi:hypothetical protein
LAHVQTLQANLEEIKPDSKMGNPMSDRFWNGLSSAFFLGLSLLVLLNFLDYGLTMDEEYQRTYGDYVLSWYSSLFRDRQALSFLNHLGAFFEIVAQLAAKVSPLGVYETRHLVNASFGLLGIYAAYRVGSYVYNRSAGLLSALFLTFTPGFYGHMFNNSKDIPFATLFLISLLFILRSYDSLPRIPWSLVFKIGICIGLAAGIRVVGLILLACMAALWAVGLAVHYFWIRAEHQPGILRQLLTLAGSFVSVTLTAWVTMLLCWPWAQVSIVGNPISALRSTAHFDHDLAVFFGGQDFSPRGLPWTYLPTWLAISLPEFYFVCLAVGLVLAYRFVSTMARTPNQLGQLVKVGMLVLGFCAPILALIVLRSTQYDGIRHLLFVFPPLAVLSGVSFAALLQSKSSALIRYGCAALTLVCMGITAVDMIQLHPYQSVYFNRVIAGGLASASQRFESDYWGNSYREGAQWVIQNYRPDTSGRIRVANCSNYFQTGYFFEGPDVRRRFVNVERYQDPHVFLTTTRWNCHENPWGRLLHVVQRQGVPLLYIFEVRSPSSELDGEDPDFTFAESVLPDNAFNATIAMVNQVDQFRAGLQQTLDVTVKNTSGSVWPALTRNDSRFRVRLGNHWFDESGKTFALDDGRSELPFDVKPGEQVLMQLAVRPPNKPGRYVLEIDMLQEKVTWFSQKGSKTLRTKVRVD